MTLTSFISYISKLISVSFPTKYINLLNALLMNQLYNFGSLINELNKSFTFDKNYTLTESKSEDSAILLHGPVALGHSASEPPYLIYHRERRYPTPRTKVGLQ